MGGWAVVSVENPPDYLLAGKPVAFTFVVRQHGVKRLGGLDVPSMPYAPAMEEAFMPTPAKITKALRGLAAF